MGRDKAGQRAWSMASKRPPSPIPGPPILLAGHRQPPPRCRQSPGFHSGALARLPRTLRLACTAAERRDALMQCACSSDDGVYVVTVTGASPAAPFHLHPQFQSRTPGPAAASSKGAEQEIGPWASAQRGHERTASKRAGRREGRHLRRLGLSPPNRACDGDPAASCRPDETGVEGRGH